MANLVKKKYEPINPKLARTSRLVVAGALGIIMAFLTMGMISKEYASGYLFVLVVVSLIQFYMAYNRTQNVAIQEQYVPEKSKVWDVLKKFNKDVMKLDEYQAEKYRNQHPLLMKSLDQVVHFGVTTTFVVLIWLIVAALSFF